MRKAPDRFSPPALESIQLHRNEVKRYSCTLVTPLYGGGVSAGEVDEAMPIRVTSIRGQLRFWWRVAHRTQFLDANRKVVSSAMFKIEREIWGGLGDSNSLAASKVDIRVVELQKHTDPQAAAEYPKDGNGGYKTFPRWAPWVGNAGAYVLFPAQGKASKTAITQEPKRLYRPDSLSWVLEIQFRDDCSQEEQDQVHTALRWWASFGGVGGRTRRGLGAVHIQELPPVTAQEAKDQGCTLVRQSAVRDAKEAWFRAIAAMRDFRQKPGFGRNPGSEPNRPGRSRWPEADAIRRFSGRNTRQHAPQHPAGNIFPRAQFGMPIIFHFKDRDDPGDHTLKPEDAERLASPIILRPYWNGSEWQPAALYLGYSRLPVILGAGRRVQAIDVWPDSEEGRQQAIHHIQPLRRINELNGNKIRTPLAAFLNYFKDPKKYTEEN